MKNIFALFALTVLFAACSATAPTPAPGASPSPAPATGIGCVIQDAVVNTVAVSLSDALQCSNQSAVAASLTTAAAGLKICSSAQAMAIGKPHAKSVKGQALKSIGSDLCQSLASSLVSGLAQGALPAAWGCTAASASQTITTLVDAGCVKAFP